MGQYTEAVQKLYVAYFNRPADAAGLAYWESVVAAANGNTAAVSAAFSTSAEYKAAYGNLDAYRVVQAVYNNLFGRDPEPAGLTFWGQALIRGDVTIDKVVTQVAAGAQTSDLEAYENKVAAATAFTASLDSTDEIINYSGDKANQVAKDWMATITTDATLTAALDPAALAATVEAVTEAGEVLPPVEQPITFNMTTGVESVATFTGKAGDDVFNADLSTSNTNTLNTLDRINGGAGTDTLNAIIVADVTPASLASIEVVNVTNADTSAHTLGLANAANVTHVNNLSSTDDVTVTGIASGALLSVSNTDENTTFSFADAGASDTAKVTVSSVTGAASVTIDDVGTIAMTSTGGTNSYTVNGDSVTTLTLAGDAAQTVALGGAVLNVTKFDASAATAGVTLTTVDQTGITSASTDVTVRGGAGNDAFTLVESNDLNVDMGAGNDSVTILAIDAADTVVGGAGTDTLNTTNAQANVLDAVTDPSNVSGFEALGITTTLDGNLAVRTIDTGIVTVTLRDAATLATGSDDTITGGAGTFAVNLGRTAAGFAGDLEGALVVRDTGTAVTDSVTISSRGVNSTTNTSFNVFGGQDVTSTGYENVTIATGTASNLTQQTIGTLTITPDVVTDTAVSLTVTGDNRLDINSVTTTSTGLLTINASGMTAAAAGTSTLDIAAISQGTGGTASITGSAGDDVVVAGNFKTTMVGGAGDDTLTGGTAADNLSGGAGDDQITGSGGNDILAGGDGDDTIDATGGGAVSIDAGAGDDTVSMGTTLAATDTLVGGAGTDILSVTAAVSTGTIGSVVSGFETLSTTATAQAMSNFTNNVFTTILQAAGGNGTLAITNAGTTTNTLEVDEADALVTSFSRLADGSADSLTVIADQAIIATSALTASGEETIIINAADADVDLDLVTATSLTTLTVSGDNDVVIDAQGATGLKTVTASGMSGSTITVNIDASDSTTALTFVGGTNTGTTTLVTGSGADLVTAGSSTAVLNATTGLGADTVVGNGGADVIASGSGNDSVTGGEGADSITGGSGNDTIILTETTAAVDVVVLTSTGVDTVTGFSYGASGDQLEFDISDLEASFNVDLVNLDDGASTGAADGLIQEVTADVAATADATFFVLRGATFDTTADVENALETGDFEISHAGGAAGDGFLVAYSDGVDVYIALVRDNVATSATDWTAGELTVTNLVRLTGNTSLSAGEFNIANFDFIA